MSGGKSEIWKAFSGLPLSVLDKIRSGQYDTDQNIINQKLTSGLAMAHRLLQEINVLHEKSKETERYYTERYAAKCRQWNHNAQLKVIWDNNPHLPLFGASEILAGRDPFDPNNEFSPGAAGAAACRNEAAAKAWNSKSNSTSSWYPEEAPWAHQARMDTIEAQNYRIWKAELNAPDTRNACPVKPR